MRYILEKPHQKDNNLFLGLAIWLSEYKGKAFFNASNQQEDAMSLRETMIIG